MPDLERYERNILTGKITSDGQRKINNSKVLIAGLGGLGSAVIVNLAGLGVENFGLLDFDKVSLSNLNRQFIYNEEDIGNDKTQRAQNWLSCFNKNVKTKAYNIKFDKTCFEILTQYDYVIDCFDNWESKFLLNRACVESGKILIHAGVEMFGGQIMIIQPHKSACLNCILEQTSPPVPQKGIVLPIVNIIGALASFELIKLITGDKSVSIETFLSYDVSMNKLTKLKTVRNNKCKVCG